MFDIGWSELLLIGVVALIVVGPKDLPRMFHHLGRITAKARAMAREFSSAMEEAAKSSGLDEAARDLNSIKGMTSKSMGLDTLEKATETFEKWQPRMPGSGGPPGAGATPDPAAPAPAVKKPAASKPAAKKPAAQKHAASKSATVAAQGPAKARSKASGKTPGKTPGKAAAKSPARTSAPKAKA